MAIQLCTTQGDPTSSDAALSNFCWRIHDAIDDYTQGPLQDLIDGVTTEITEEISLVLFLIDANVVTAPAAPFATWEEFEMNFLEPLYDTEPASPPWPEFDLKQYFTEATGATDPRQLFTTLCLSEA